MRNEKGITLVELLATLAIAGIVVALIASVLSSGTSASQRTGMNQRLQQEGNIIVEQIRSHYLLNQRDAAVSNTFEVFVQDNKLILKDGTNANKVLSEGYFYDLDPSDSATPSTMNKTVLDRTRKSDFNLIIRSKSNGDASVLEYKVNTSFSKLK